MNILGDCSTIIRKYSTKIALNGSCRFYERNTVFGTGIYSLYTSILYRLMSVWGQSILHLADLRLVSIQTSHAHTSRHICLKDHEFERAVKDHEFERAVNQVLSVLGLH